MNLGFDCINIRGGGITHIQNILNYTNRKNIKFKKIIIWGNKEVLNSIKSKKFIIKIYNKIYEKNLLLRLLWKFFFFKNSINKNKVNCMFFLSGFFLNKYTDKSVIYLQNILPFLNKYTSKYSLIAQIKFFFLKKIYLFSINRSDYIIFPSKSFQNIFKKLKINTKSSVIYHGAKKKFFNPKYSKEIKMVNLSSLEPFKNHSNLLEALKQLKKEKYNFFIDFYGPGSNSQVEKFKNTIKKNFPTDLSVRYLGTKSQNFKFRNYNVLINSSFCESFGLPVVEALNSGMKIVCSNIAVFNELLRDYPIYFNPHSPVSIKNAIKKIRLKKINLNARKKLIKKFNWKKSSKQTFDLLYKISKNEIKKNISYCS